MIVPMKKITLLCMDSERVAALEKLRGLGVMHVDLAARVESESVAVLAQAISDAAKALNILTTPRKTGKIHPEDPRNGKEILKETISLFETRARLEKQRDTLLKEIEKLSRWGDFRPELTESIRRGGIFVYFCEAYHEIFKKIEIPEDVVLKIVNKFKNEVCFLLISPKELEESAFPVVKLPEESLSGLSARLEKLQSEIQDIDSRLEALSHSVRKLKEYIHDLKAEYEFASNRDGMAASGGIAYIDGYVPVPEMERLAATARSSGWGLRIEDPAPDDMRVPTLIQKPKWMKVIDPLFDFIGIAPGYREPDVTIFFLIAFPIFFGMLIGDFAYGFLFFTSGFLCKYLFRKNEAAQMPLNLLIMLSVFSMIWGLLTGSCMGLPRDILPRFLQGLDFLADPAKSPAACALAKKLHISNPADLTNKYVQWFCFLLAALHLSSARIYKNILDFRNWRSFGNLGWACLIWGNFFTAVNLIVFPGTFPKYVGFTLYGVGFVLIVATITGEAALNLPFAIVGSFVDVLSYIRLFAVGLSGLYVATCFNNMGKMVMDALPGNLAVIGIAGLILVALAGHILNILLGFMGVLVHAVRLNTLEFSNHIEMQWTGTNYRPFAEKIKKKSEEQT